MDYYEIDIVAEATKKAFNIEYLYPWQRLVIANILDPVIDEDSGEITKNFQIVLLPTGAGKSLCFLVPALLLNGPTLILYPLLALMSDQARRMTEGGMTPVVFRGQQTKEEREENFRLIENGAKVILANPEVLQSEELVKRLTQCGIEHIAIDEAHCVSEWGDSFRPAYLTLGSIIEKLNVPRVTAFTATASPEVLSRVNEVLFNGSGKIVRSEADRPNIHYFVRYAYAKEKAVLDLVEKEEKPLLVFCGTRKRTEMMAHLIAEELSSKHPEKKDCVRFYHAGLTKEEKDATEKWFHPHKNGIMAVTCAFGMGVDKKDIKTVIHLDVPQTAEAFIQEAGRGGRDGSIAKSFLVWGPDDSRKSHQYEENSRGRVMGLFAESTTCRRQVLLDALGAEQAPCTGCDICQGLRPPLYDDAEYICNFVGENSGAYSIYELASSLTNKNIDKSTATSKNKRNKGVLSYSPLLEHQDYVAIIKELINQKKLTMGKFFWKKTVCKSRNVSPQKIK